jgi:hypothetical protein
MNNEEMIVSGSTAGDILMHDVVLGSVRESFTYSMRNKEGINNVKVSDGDDFRRVAACTNGGSV